LDKQAPGIAWAMEKWKRQKLHMSMSKDGLASGFQDVELIDWLIGWFVDWLIDCYVEAKS
jgi:hypothetical protein